MTENVLQETNFLVLLDKIFCFRAWGLILYGALPSNLALLGALKINKEIFETDKLLSFFPACLLPIGITFLLIRARHRDWYLTSDFVNLRSAVSTFMILILATLICAFSIIVHKEGESDNSVENNIGIFEHFKWEELKIIAPQAFLLAVVSLVISSTLFITVLTKKVNLPGLPSVELVELIDKIRNNMRKIMGSQIWGKYISVDDRKLINMAEEVKNDIDQVAVCTGSYFVKKSLELIRIDIVNLKGILEEVRCGGNKEAKETKWNLYLAKAEDLIEANMLFRPSKIDQIASLDRLKKLKLGV